MKIGQHTVGESRCLIIAEAGVNHNGDINIAKRLIKEAASAGVDAIKFQVFNPDEIVTKSAGLAGYQKSKTDSSLSQRQMLNRLTLSLDEFRIIRDETEKHGLTFLATPFDIDSAIFLSELSVPILKIASGEITNLPFLQEVAALGLPVILSTGASNLDEVSVAVNILKDAGLEFSLLHCVSAYPAPAHQVNLRAMETLRNTFGVPVGYSDHTLGIGVGIAAAALGASIIEKHFTLDRTMIGPDHIASLEPVELCEFVKGIRVAELALGSYEKCRQPCEEDVVAAARRSLVVAYDLKRGHIIKCEDIVIQRPGTGISPACVSDILGKKLCSDTHEGTLFSMEMFL
jgi:N-acetylneuraminate synthase